MVLHAPQRRMSSSHWWTLSLDWQLLSAAFLRTLSCTRTEKAVRCPKVSKELAAKMYVPNCLWSLESWTMPLLSLIRLESFTRDSLLRFVNLCFYFDVFKLFGIVWVVIKSSYANLILIFFYISKGNLFIKIHYLCDEFNVNTQIYCVNYYCNWLLLIITLKTSVFLLNTLITKNLVLIGFATF